MNAITATRRRTDAEVRQELALLRAEHAELIGQARAAVAASRLGEPAPLVFLEGYLEEHGQVPAPGARPAVLLAQAYAASIDVYSLAGDERS